MHASRTAARGPTYHHHLTLGPDDVAGTLPTGSTWAKNPIPDYGSDSGAPSFPPPCPELAGCTSSHHMDNRCRCSGEWGPYDLECAPSPAPFKVAPLTSTLAAVRGRALDDAAHDVSRPSCVCCGT
jgi:hypothetical protein